MLRLAGWRLPMRLLVARHGATAYNRGGRITGQTDAPLSPLGLRQADALAARLAGLRFDALVSSDLIRASVTAERIAQAIGMPVTLDPALREIAMGAWEGRTGDELRRESPERFARLIEDPLGEEAAPGGESWARFTARVDAARAHWQARYPHGRVLWVAHGGVVSALLLRALGLTYDRRDQFARDNTSLFEFDYLRGRVVIVRANDTSHLAGFSDDEDGERFQAL